jgi:Cu(I)/Ag(I) efflux system membrane protein CusA/SilA
VIFLWHFRSILIVTLPLPLAVAGSFLFMHYADISSNIMSLGGIAIAIGVLVDAGIVMTENVLRHAERYYEEHGEYQSAIGRITLEAAKFVGRPIFFAMTIIILAFVPVFALTGMEGKMFHPLAFTKTFAMVCSTLIAVTLVPVLCTFLIRGKLHREDANPVMHALGMIYKPVLRWALKHRITTLSAAVVVFASAVWLATTIGSEFMPPLDEETALFMPITDPSISLTKATDILRWQDRIIAQDPMVESVVGKIGRAESAIDPAPVNMTETVINFKPKDKWPAGTTKEAILQRLDEKLRLPGVTNIWTQPIRNRIDMLSTGIRTQVGVKVFGNDLATIEQKETEIERALRSVPGVADLYAERITGAPYLEIKVNREAAARYGLNVGDVQDVIETAIGGKNLTTAIDGRQRLPVRVRYSPDFRQDPEELRNNILVTASNGAQIPLGQVADLGVIMGPSMISSENGLLRGSVLMNVRGRDVGRFVDEAQHSVAKAVKMPPGYYIEWSGQYENQISAKKRLELVIPIVFLIIFLLLYKTYNSFKEASHVILAVPFALSGGVFLLKLLGYNFSVAVWVGFIALFGTAVQTGVVMVIYLEEAVERKRAAMGGLTVQSLREAVMEGALLRLRPKIMTVSTVVAGLLPIMWSTRTGAEVMKPLATPVLGGMVSSLLHVLIVTPVIFTWLRERELSRKETAPAA